MNAEKNAMTAMMTTGMNARIGAFKISVAMAGLTGAKAAIPMASRLPNVRRIVRPPAAEMVS